MATEGIEAVFLETRNWGKAARLYALSEQGFNAAVAGDDPADGLAGGGRGSGRQRGDADPAGSRERAAGAATGDSAFVVVRSTGISAVVTYTAATPIVATAGANAANLGDLPFKGECPFHLDREWGKGRRKARYTERDNGLT